MTDLTNVFAPIVASLEDNDIPYIVVGSIAATSYDSDCQQLITWAKHLGREADVEELLSIADL